MTRPTPRLSPLCSSAPLPLYFFLVKPFSSSHVNQMLGSLSQAGLVYKNRHGRYSFAVPLLGQFILRQIGHGV